MTQLTAFNMGGISTDTLSLTDYQMVNKTTAKVIIAFTGNLDKDAIQQRLSAKMDYMAAPVENSFRLLQAGVAVGFMRQNRPVRVINNENELRAGYKVMASNILMDASDESLWEIKQGAGGRYLARTDEEDLSNLISASTNHRGNVPKIHNIAISAACKKEFVAFVGANAETDYGFCVAASADKGKLKIVSYATRSPVIIANDAVVSIHQIKTRRSVHERIIASGISREDKNQSVEYYKKLFGYDSNYLADIINFIETDAVA